MGIPVRRDTTVPYINICNKKSKTKEVVHIEELLDPKNDYVFKRIFGRTGNEEITKQLLDTIIKEEINEITVDENPILEKDLLDDKLGIIDIHAKINKEIDVDIEMQIVDKHNAEKRIMFYWSMLYTKQIKAGEDYTKLNKTIAVLIVDYELENLKKIPKSFTKWQIREEEYSTVILTDVLEICIIELPKAKRNTIKTEQELKPWIAFLENPKEVVKMSKANAVAIEKAKEVLKEISEDEHERYLAFLRQKYIMDQKATEQAGYYKGLKAGKEERNAATEYKSGKEQRYTRSSKTTIKSRNRYKNHIKNNRHIRKGFGKVKINSIQK